MFYRLYECPSLVYGRKCEGQQYIYDIAIIVICTIHVHLFTVHICIFETNCEQRYQRWSDDIFYIQFSVQIEILLYQVEILIHFTYCWISSKFKNISETTTDFVKIIFFDDIYIYCVPQGRGNLIITGRMYCTTHVRFVKKK